jgi:hypothetical protein
MLACQIALLYLWVKIKCQNEAIAIIKRPSSSQSNKSTEASIDYEASSSKSPLNNVVLFGQSIPVLPDIAYKIYMHFWFWDSFYSYAKFLAGFTIVVGIITGFLHANPVFQHLIAFASSGVEACLGVPQFILNYKRQNTSGLAYVKIPLTLCL